MAFEQYVRSGNKLLRCGFTTGTCAALAAQGSAILLLTGTEPQHLTVVTPKGWPVTVAPAGCRLTQTARGAAAVCGVVKDAGDDPDTTDGMTIEVTCWKTDEPGVSISGGSGVGRVTRPGLDQPVGAAAINRVPRQMITGAVRRVCEDCGYEGGIAVCVSIPGGQAAAEKTFNPLLGVEGGLSVLGTDGIVEPMSTQAVVDTITAELRQAAEEERQAAEPQRQVAEPQRQAAAEQGGSSGPAGREPLRIILTPGNYGADYIRACGYDEFGVRVVKISNYLGQALDAAVVEGFEEVLLVGHIGKLVKAAGGIMNTHSKSADCRRELFTAYAAIAGASTEVCRQLMGAVTTDACIAILNEAGLETEVMASLTDAIQRALNRRVQDRLRIGAVVFSNEYGRLGVTKTAKELLNEWKK